MVVALAYGLRMKRLCLEVDEFTVFMIIATGSPVICHSDGPSLDPNATSDALMSKAFASSNFPWYLTRRPTATDFRFTSPP